MGLSPASTGLRPRRGPPVFLRVEISDPSLSCLPPGISVQQYPRCPDLTIVIWTAQEGPRSVTTVWHRLRQSSDVTTSPPSSALQIGKKTEGQDTAHTVRISKEHLLHLQAKVSIILFFYFYFFYFGLWGLSSLTRDRIKAPHPRTCPHWKAVLTIGPPGKSQHTFKEFF